MFLFFLSEIFHMRNFGRITSYAWKYFKRKNLKIFSWVKSRGNCACHIILTSTTLNFRKWKQWTVLRLILEHRNFHLYVTNLNSDNPSSAQKSVTIWKLFVNCVEFRWWSQFNFFFINIIVSSAFGSHPEEKVRLKERDLVNFSLLIMIPSGENSGWRILCCWCELYLFSG